jgi:hypothetical protein
MVDSMSTEAGKFFYGFLSQAIIDFFQRKESVENKLSITTIESWRPIITMLDYLKAVHNLSQSYLLSGQYNLFGGSTEPIITSSNITPGSIKDKWSIHYHDDFHPQIGKFKIKQKSLFSEIDDNKIDIEQLRRAMGMRQAVNEELTGFEESAPQAHEKICEFIKTLAEIAEDIKEGRLGLIDSWGKKVKDLAKKTVRHSDESIVRVIPILTYLYEEALR